MVEIDNERLVFVDVTNEKTLDGKYLYKLYFSNDSSVVWGDYWNVVPCSIIPDIHPLRNALSSIVEFKSDIEYNLAKTNSCFSMQDAIDGIIALLFTSPRAENVLVLRFDETKPEVLDKLKNGGIEISKDYLLDQTDDIVNATIRQLEQLQAEENDDNDGFEDF